ncbi:MAG: hypothetical protein IPL32_19990 [Chloracidobacterium sp.]|nr:hypothetical protein [Chloracidobacterium sp.]
MNIEENYGIAKIKDEGTVHQLSISWDFDGDISEVDERYPTMLFTPDTFRDLHFHIDLTDEEAIRLYQWLGAYLDMKKIK